MIFFSFNKRNQLELPACGKLYRLFKKIITLRISKIENHDVTKNQLVIIKVCGTLHLPLCI